MVQQLLAYAREAGLTLTGRPFELYEIDNRDTVRPEEFLTEVQVGVREERNALEGLVK